MTVSARSTTCIHMLKNKTTRLIRYTEMEEPRWWYLQGAAMMEPPWRNVWGACCYAMLLMIVPTPLPDSILIKFNKLHGYLSSLETALPTDLQLVCPCRCPYNEIEVFGRWSPPLHWLYFAETPTSNPQFLIPNHMNFAWSLGAHTSPSKPPSMELLSESRAGCPWSTCQSRSQHHS